MHSSSYVHKIKIFRECILKYELKNFQKIWFCVLFFKNSFEKFNFSAVHSKSKFQIFFWRNHNLDFWQNFVQRSPILGKIYTMFFLIYKLININQYYFKSLENDCLCSSLTKQYCKQDQVFFFAFFDFVL